MKKDDEINTNAEYEEVSTLNEILGKDGEVLDPIEQNQDPLETVEGNESAREELEKAIIGEENDQDDIGNE